MAYMLYRSYHVQLATGGNVHHAMCTVHLAHISCRVHRALREVLALGVHLYFALLKSARLL